MISKAFLVTALIAYAEARFGQEQVPIQAISAVQGGDPGAAATVAGAAISDLLGGANSCAKVHVLQQYINQEILTPHSSSAPTKSSANSAAARTQLLQPLASLQPRRTRTLSPTTMFRMSAVTPVCLLPRSLEVLRRSSTLLLTSMAMLQPSVPARLQSHSRLMD